LLVKQGSVGTQEVVLKEKKTFHLDKKNSEERQQESDDNLLLTACRQNVMMTRKQMF
jgi:hypothetical protein